MRYHIGLDVGGTFTDAVLTEGNRIVTFAKVRTSDDVLSGVIEALERIVADVPPENIRRVTLSTTAVTNAIVENRAAKVDLFVIPGPGVDVSAGVFPVAPIVCGGYTDHRGVLTARTSRPASYVRQSDIAAVSGKFSVRNPKAERELAISLGEDGYRFVSEGAALSGSLNFIRRTVSAYYNSAVYDAFASFREAIEAALRGRAIEAPVYILKADGGALPIADMAERPVESVFTGPAASVLGLKAIGAVPPGCVVAADIGGTTTDLSLWRDGEAVMARGGASIRGYRSSVRSYHTVSIGVGGESYVGFENGIFTVGPERRGQSVALGGTEATLGDALIASGRASYGDVEAAARAVGMLARRAGLDDVKKAAECIVTTAVETICRTIDDMIAEENMKPVYEVKDVVCFTPFEPTHLVGVGGTADALAPLVAGRIGISHSIPPHAPIVNALGAAFAVETRRLTVRVDTSDGVMSVPEFGLVMRTGIETMAELREAAGHMLTERANDGHDAAQETDGGRAGTERKAEYSAEDIEVIEEESVPVMRNRYTAGRVMTVTVQGKAGVRRE